MFTYNKLHELFFYYLIVSIHQNVDEEKNSILFFFGTLLQNSGKEAVQVQYDQTFSTFFFKYLLKFEIRLLIFILSIKSRKH